MKEKNCSQNVLVATKLLVPALPQRLIPRHHLMETLEQGLERKMTLVCAPAGFGKTTLLSQWLHSIQETSQTRPAQTRSKLDSLKVAWVSLDETDNDLVLFWQYVMAALEYAAPGLVNLLVEQLQTTSEPLVQSILTLLINRIAESEQSFVLILDDYQHIKTSTIHSSLSYLLDHLPRQLHIFVLTRSEPPLPLSRLRARGQILELNNNSLRCTLLETEEFLRNGLTVCLPAELVQEVFLRTQGWLVGLQLIGLSMQGEWACESVVKKLSSPQPYILEYLTQNVLQPQPLEVQTFLLYTSILPQFCADLCDTLLDRTDSRAMLDYLYASNLFIVRLDGQPGWYRYHPLFAEVLLYHLNTLELKTGQNLHKLAGQWYARQEQSTESVKFTPNGVQTASLFEPPVSFSWNDHNSPKIKPDPDTRFCVRALSDNLPLFLEPLSERELEVLNLLRLGTANQDIATQLTVSLNTVKKHNSSIFSKLGVPNRTQAVYLARKLGLVVD